MKHILFVFCIGLFTASTVYSQLELGVKTGLNASSSTGDFVGDTYPRISFHVGAYVDIPIKGKFSFQPEVLYSSQGYINKLYIDDFDSSFYPDTGGNYTFKIARNFLTIPLITKLHFNKILALEFGPQMGFLLNGKTKTNSDGQGGNKKVETFDGNFRFDIGPTLGVGISPSPNFRIQLRGFIGLSDLFRKEQIGNTTYNYDNFDIVVQLSVGYAIL